MKELHVAIQKNCRHIPTLEAAAIKMSRRTHGISRGRECGDVCQQCGSTSRTRLSSALRSHFSTAAPLRVGAPSFRNHFSFTSPNSIRAEGDCKMLSRPLRGIFLAIVH